MDAAARGLAGSLTSMICTPPMPPFSVAEAPPTVVVPEPLYDATSTYDAPSISTDSAAMGSCSSVKPPGSSVTAPSTTSLSGSVMSTTCMP